MDKAPLIIGDITSGDVCPNGDYCEAKDKACMLPHAAKCNRTAQRDADHAHYTAIHEAEIAELKKELFGVKAVYEAANSACIAWQMRAEKAKAELAEVKRRVLIIQGKGAAIERLLALDDFARQIREAK